MLKETIVVHLCRLVRSVRYQTALVPHPEFYRSLPDLSRYDDLRPCVCLNSTHVDSFAKGFRLSHSRNLLVRWDYNNRTTDFCAITLTTERSGGEIRFDSFQWLQFICADNIHLFGSSTFYVAFHQEENFILLDEREWQTFTFHFDCLNAIIRNSTIFF